MPVLSPCTDFAALCWIEAHPGLAGYVQAVGAVAAILVSVQLARSSAKRERQADEAAARRMIEADAAQRAREVAADQAAEFRLEKAKIEAHNGVVQRVTTWGILAADECRSQLISERQFHINRTGSAQGRFNSPRLAEMRERLARLEDEVSDIELAEAIGTLREVVQAREIKGDTGPEYIDALEAELARIFDALGAIESLRRPLPAATV